MTTTTDIILNLLHIIIFIATIFLFIRSIIQQLRVVGKGRKPDSFAPMSHSVYSVIKNVIFQDKLFRYPLRGLMHLFVFYGFLVYSLHTISQMITGNLWTLIIQKGEDPYTLWLSDNIGIFSPKIGGSVTIVGLVLFIAVFFLYRKQNAHSSAFSLKIDPKTVSLVGLLLFLSVAILAPVFFSGTHFYKNVLDWISLFVITALLFFSFRRWVFKRPELDRPSIPSLIVISMISILMFSTLIGNSAQSYIMASTAGEASFSWIGKIISNILRIENDDSAIFIRNISWWTHIYAVYAFMVYVPNSKHAHLIFAPVNFFLIKNSPAGALDFMNLEDEEGAWGAAKVADLKWNNLLDGLSCIECGRCTLVCPANRTGKKLDPKQIIVKIKHAMVENRAEILKSNSKESVAPILGEAHITDEELWGCTTCFACVQECPVGNNHVDSIVEMRRDLVQVESRFPQELQNAFSNMENQSNPWGIGAHARMDWCSDLDVKTISENSDAEILYWVGCAGAFDERNKKIARSFVKILKTAGVNFAILGTEENCTGDSARRAGNEYLFQTLASQNIETLNRYKVQKIVTPCPHCFNTLKNEYPQLGGNYTVVHHSEFISTLIESKKISLSKSAGDLKGVYHDSCYLGRYNSIYNEPRNIINSAGNGSLAEASDHKSNSLCCGAGGAQMWMEEKNDRINLKRTEQLMATGADTICTACPFCLTMIGDGIKSAGKSEEIKVLDIAEIVANNIQA